MSEKIVRYLRDVLQRINRIEQYVEDLDYAAFAQDGKTRDAVLRNFEVMGEAAKRVPGTFRNAPPEIPWKEISGMRDVLIHQYDQVDERIVWKTIQQRLPVLKSALQDLINHLERGV